MLIKVNDPFQVKFCAQNVEENVLTVTLIELAYGIGELIEHWKTLA